MFRDFEVKDGIYLLQGSHKIDLHNDFNFYDLHYSIKHRTLSLDWRRSEGNWVRPATPASVCVQFREVSEFRFQPRDPDLPFTEDDCMRAFGYWTDEEWGCGGIIIGDDRSADPTLRTAIGFMSRSTIIVQAISAHAKVEV